MLVQRGVPAEYAFNAPAGATPGIAIANIPFGTGYQLARTTAGITETDPGQFFTILPQIPTNGTFAILVDDGAGNYAGENLEVTEDGLPPTREAGGGGKLVVDTGGLTGLVGTIGVLFRDTPATTIVAARSTSGISEETGTGVYAWRGNWPNVTGTVSAIWDTGGGSPLYASEEVTLTPSFTGFAAVAPATHITRVWVDDTNLYDSADSSSLFILTTPTRRALLSSAKPRDEMESRADGDGAIDVTAFYEPRVFDPFEGKIRAADFPALMSAQNQLTQLFSLNGLHELGWEMGDGSTRTALVRAASELAVDTIQNGPHAVFSIQLVAPDPLLTSQTVKSASLDPLASGLGGALLPFTLPVFIGSTSTAETSLLNEGTRRAMPVVTFEGPWDNPWVENASTGERFQTIGLSLAAGETAVADMGAHSFTRIGSPAPDLVDWARSVGPWVSIPPGKSLLRTGGLPGTGSLLQIDYRDTYV